MGLDIEQFKLTCNNCSNEWTPRKSKPKKCPKCGSTDYKSGLSLRPRRELYLYWMVFVIAGMGLVLLGVTISVLNLSYGTIDFTPLAIGIAACSMMMVLGSPYWIEYRIYPLLYGKPESRVPIVAVEKAKV